MKLAAAALSIVILAEAGYIAAGAMHPVAKQSAAVAEVTQMPAGITFQTVGAATAMSAMGAFRGYQVIANEKHHTIYTSDADTTPDKVTCTGDCAKDFTPLVAPDGAKSSGFWHVITRPDGTKQWSRHGKPLYLNVNDKNVGDTKGKQDGWNWVLNNAMYNIPMPDGITSQELPGAGGQALVDAKGRTIYVFNGDMKNDKLLCGQSGAQTPCDNQFQPVLAAQLADPLGKFTPVARPDGTLQWSFEGQPLYTYAGDAEHGDSKGRIVDARFKVALAEKYFEPTNVRFGINTRGMDYLTDDKGMTLYARDRFHFQVGGFSLRGGQAGVAQLGQFLGTSTCTGDCTKTYIPVSAPDDAVSSGYWSVMKRKEGGKQWAYMGYALYSYVGDQKPGDETSQDNFDISLGKTLPPIPQNPIDAVSALYWREVTTQ